jgi:hypothetical protein
MYELISSHSFVRSRALAAAAQIALDQRPRFCEISDMTSPRKEGAIDMCFHRTLGSLTSALILCLATMAGCASDQTMSKTAASADPLASQARRMRGGEADRDGTGLSSRTRDVEKDLNLR